MEFVCFVIPRSRVKDVLTELHGGSSGGHLCVNKTLSKVRQRFYWLRARADIENGADSATPVQPVADREPGIGAKYTSIMSELLSKE
jgi:hypothetical protein